MAKFEFDSLLRRRVEQAESQQRERDERAADAAPHVAPLFVYLGAMCGGIVEFIAEYCRRFGPTKPGELRVVTKPGEIRVVRVRVVDPSPTMPGLPPRPHRDESEQQRPRHQERPAPPAPVEVAAAPTDPFGYQRMSIAELHAAGRQPMPAAQRVKLERVLNMKIKAQREPQKHDLTADEHERLTKQNIGWWH